MSEQNKHIKIGVERVERYVRERGLDRNGEVPHMIFLGYRAGESELARGVLKELEANKTYRDNRLQFAMRDLGWVELLSHGRIDYEGIVTLHD